MNTLHQWLEGKKKPWNGMMNYKYVREFIDYDELIEALPTLLSTMEAEIRERIGGDEESNNIAGYTIKNEERSRIHTLIKDYFKTQI